MFDDDLDADDDSLPMRELLRIAGGGCVDCRHAYTAREAVFSIALGFKTAPRCLGCLVTRLGREAGELQAQLVQYIHGRECYLKAWRVAERIDRAADLASGGHQPPVGTGEGEDPAEPRVSPGSAGSSPSQRSEESGGVRPPLAQEAADTWDAGDMGCGELVMALRLRMNSIPPGGVIRVTATDPAAPEDLPAWCRMTGHPLITADHPHYLIQRRGE